ncbi:hypothetical protein BUALT_Bualt06G0004100 [Buddleja alternifolia]|uniref:RNA-binding protein Luc7-like 2 n=1 Tax=Buddleja alternifolia TaxID=168488 RepID=A0AAV6XJY6_9LAMI|nr:hypothetical protein BUALT_Bualt06G0004100 [Buddleja alternifolia]
MDALRKQLDVLMGANRNGDTTEVTRKYYDRDVCRLYLAGLCPHELFQLTKMDKGPCPKVHSLQLRKEYEESKAKGLDNYDRDLEDNIDRLIVECDRKIERALKRLDEEDAKAAIAISVSEVTESPEIIELSKQIKEKLKEADQYDLEGNTDMKIRTMEDIDELRIKRADKQSVLLLDAFNKDRASLPQPLTNAPQLASLPTAVPDPHIQEMINEKLKKAEDLGEQGMVDEAQKALEEAEALKKLPPRQEPVLDPSKYTAADVRITDQKLRVCDICGAFLSVYDSDRRLADHFGGKLHLGYMQIREKLAELQVCPHHLASALVHMTFFFSVINMIVCLLIQASTSRVHLLFYTPMLMVISLSALFKRSLMPSIPKLVLGIFWFRKRKKRNVKHLKKREDQEIGKAGIETQNLAEIVVKVIAVNVEGTMIVGTEVVIGKVTATVTMIVSVKEIGTVVAVTEDLVPVQKNVQEIMIAPGFVSEALHIYMYLFFASVCP